VSDSSELREVSLTWADIVALKSLSRGDCVAADRTYGDSAVDRRVVQRLVANELAVVVSLPNTTIDRVRITELGRSALRQLTRED
jgi:hypothetical protein